MNQFFFETRGREKVREIMNEGLTGQELQRSGAPRYVFFSWPAQTDRDRCVHSRSSQSDRPLRYKWA